MKCRHLLTIPILISSLGANADVSLDGTLGRGGALPGPDYLIGADLGQQHGGNLFHSFQDFNLNSFESATFSGPDNVNNVISRVTGGNSSLIDGLIRSTISNADMYFFNPYGMMFGENALLDVQGSFHASTADYLRLEDGGRFDARNPSESLLTVAPVSAFGFFTDSPASLSIEGSQLSVPTEKTLSLISGNLTINQAELAAPYGRLNLASVAGMGEVIPKYDDFIVPTLRGDITVQNSLISTNGEGGGAIYIRGGQFVLDNTMVEADTHGAIDGIGIDVQADALIATHGAKISSTTFGTGQGGNTHIKVAGDVILFGEDQVGSVSKIIATTEGTTEFAGNGGKIELEAGQLIITDGGQIGTTTFGTGQGGNTHIKVAGNVTIFGESRTGFSSGVFANSQSEADKAGDGGSVILEAKELVIMDGAVINASTWGAGQGGNIKIGVTDSVTLRGENSTGTSQTQIRASTGSTDDSAGNGGTIELEAGQLVIADGGQINATTLGAGQGGNIKIRVTGLVSLLGEKSDGYGSSISANTESTTVKYAGNSGTIELEAGQLIIADGGQIGTTTFGTGHGGNTYIKVAGNVTLSGEGSAGFNSGVFANSQSEADKAGDGGSVILEAEELIIKDGAIINVSTWGAGQGGNIKIRVTGPVSLSGERSDGYGSSISANTESTTVKYAGNSGTIELEAGQLIIADGGQISTITFGTGQGGNIHIKVAGNVILFGERAIGFGSAIYATSQGTTNNAGDGGSVVLDARELTLKDGGKISASTLGAGQGGDVYIRVDSVNILGEESAGTSSGIYLVSTSEDENAGQGGTLMLEAEELIIKDGAIINVSTWGAGQGGNIKIRVTGPVSLSGERSDGYGSSINADTTNITEIAAGKGGTIELEAGQLYLTDGANIGTSTFGTGQGGNIHIKVAGNVTLSGGNSAGFSSGIFATSQGEVNKTGDGGSVVLEAEELVITDGAAINVSTWGAGQGGNMNLKIAGNVFISGECKNATCSSSLLSSSDSETDNAGNAGTLVLEAGELHLENSAIISVKTNGSGQGGNIKIQVTGHLTLSGKNQAGYSSYIYADTEGTKEHAGKGGTIELKAEQLIIADDGRISTSTWGPGQGGNITIHAHHVRLSEGGVIAASLGQGNAGNIVLFVENALKIQKDAGISTQTNSADGGNITITSPGYLYLTPGGQITTSVGAEKGDGGNITLNPEFIILDKGKIIARAYEGQGGNIDIKATGIYTFPPESASSIDASSELGIDGNVKIESPTVDLSGALLVLATNFDASDQLRPPCTPERVARERQNFRFVVKPMTGSPPSPYDWKANRLILLPVSEEGQVKTPPTKKDSVTGQSVLTLKVASLTECQPDLSQPENVTPLESRLVPEQLF